MSHPDQDFTELLQASCALIAQKKTIDALIEINNEAWLQIRKQEQAIALLEATNRLLENKLRKERACAMN